MIKWKWHASESKYNGNYVSRSAWMVPIMIWYCMIPPMLSKLRCYLRSRGGERSEFNES